MMPDIFICDPNGLETSVSHYIYIRERMRRTTFTSCVYFCAYILMFQLLS